MHSRLGKIGTVLFCFYVCFLAHTASGATYVVNSGGGYDYTTVVACAAAASAGDTCSIMTGTYDGFTPGNGSAVGGYITFEAASGATPTISSKINVEGKSYLKFIGLSLTGGVDGIAIDGQAAGGVRGDHIQILNNTFDAFGVQLNHDDVLISGNTFNNMNSDMVKNIGNRFVVRNNTAIGITDTGDVHVDFFQGWGDTVAEIGPQYALIENNVMINGSGSNTHFFLINATDGSQPTTTVILRYNKVYNIGSGFALIDTNLEMAGGTKNHIYNNTICLTYAGAELGVVVNNYSASTYSTAKNNILYNAVTHTNAQGWTGATGWAQSYNLYYDPDNTMTFAGLAATETGAIKNENPLLADPANNDFSISTGSPAKDTGTSLTTVHADDTSSGADLIVADASFFQPGWAGVDADWIAIGTVSNIHQISTINYATNTITLTTSPARNDDDPVWLYKKSDGVQVLIGAAPDYGAYEYGTGDITSPTLSSAVVNGTTLTLGFDELVNATINTGFTVTPSGGAATVAYASGTGTAYLVYTVNRTIANGETMTLDYTQPGDGIEDTSGNDLANITGETVTVNTPAASVGQIGIGSGGSISVGSGTGSIKVD